MTTTSTASSVPAPTTKPRGGYRSIPNLQICMAWHAYKAGLMRYFDFRVYMALHEVDERRVVENRKCKCENRPVRKFRYDRERLIDEIHSLVGGVGGRHILASLRKLQRTGLLRISPTGVAFDEGPDRMPTSDLSEFWSMFDRIDKRKRIRARFVPIPRTMVRHIAGGCSAARTATMLGYAMRCLFLNQGNMSSEGSCSISFVADLFGIHPRTIKRARAELVFLGWLLPREADSWHVRTHGGRAAINLAWASKQPCGVIKAAKGKTYLPPSRRAIGTGSPPVVSKRELLPESENAEPENCGLKGRSLRRTPMGPSLRDIKLRDLREPKRTDALLRQAVSAGWVGASECERLHFHAAAAHSLAAGTVNPCGLFVYLVRGQHWDRLTLSAEDAARRNLQALEEVSSWEKTASQDPCRITILGRNVEQLPETSKIPSEVRSLVRSLVNRMNAVPSPGAPPGLPVASFVLSC